MTTYLVTPGTRGSADRIHRTTCAKAKANPAAKERNLAEPGGRILATCCKPKFGATTPAKKAAPAKAAAKKVPAKKAVAKKAAPAKAAAKKTTAKPTPEPQVPDIANARQAIAAGADPHPGRRADLADMESKAARQAKQVGEPKPPTPNADFVQKEYADGIDAAARKDLVKAYEAAQRGETKRGRGVSVQFSHDGKDCPESQNKFSSVAYWYTRNVIGDRPRVSTSELREIVTAATGVTDVENEAWETTLTNGVTLKAVKR